MQNQASASKRSFSLLNDKISSPSKQSNTVKKKAKIATNNQSNTLFNYFASNKKGEPKSELTDEVENNSQKENVSMHLVKTEPDESQSKDVKVVKNAFDLMKASSQQISNKENRNTNNSNSLIVKKSTSFSNLKEETYEDELESDNNQKKVIRKCPFYKRIEGTQIVVDAFSYGDIENCNAYFLSHYHYDHFVGLTKHFKHKIFCSQVTANLVIKQIKVEKDLVNPLELNKFNNIYPNDDSIQVALLDANHCPGSVMFLFRFKKNGKYILHTGDFRASEEVVQNKMLINIKIDTIHLDTTYCDSFYNFLPQSKIIQLGVDLAKKELNKCKKTLIVCGSYTIGKERIFIAIAEALNAKVFVTREKMKIIECLENQHWNKIITNNPNDTFIHVIPMGQLNIKDLQAHLEKYPSYENLIAIKPTGWTHKDSTMIDTKTKGLSIEKSSRNIVIYGLEYSEHSSFDELRNFISTIKPRKIIPHVNVARKESRDKMQSYFQQWLK